MLDPQVILRYCAEQSSVETHDKFIAHKATTSLDVNKKNI